jgi:hypothetical protein
MFSSIADTWRGPEMDARAAIHEAQEGKSINSAQSARDDGQPEDPYADDIHRLEAALGYPLEKGDCINFKLQDLLQIIPRKRRRIDAYRGLVGRLNKMGVKLTINSQKSR